MPSSLLSALPMATSAVACSLTIVAQVIIIIIIIIFTSSVFILLPPQPHRSAFGTLTGSDEQIAFFSERDGNQEIYVMNAGNGSNQTSLTFSLEVDSLPSWSPDGTKIAFNSERDGNQEIYVMNAGNGSNVTRLTYNDVLDAG